MGNEETDDASTRWDLGARLSGSIADHRTNGEIPDSQMKMLTSVGGQSLVDLDGGNGTKQERVVTYRCQS